MDEFKNTGMELIMKLYTEEEIRRLLKEQIIFDDEDFDKLTPIELPSDDEIWNEADKEESNSKHYAFTRGARYVIDKIQGDKK